MSDNPMFLAVRRNLQPGFVAFKQVGCRLFYTLDNVTWTLAFDYSRCETASLTQLSTINDLINAYGPDIPINPFNSETSLTGSQTGREILACPLAKWIVETYAETVRITIESRNDGQEAWKVALLGLVGAVVSIAAALATGGLSLGVSATALSFMGAGMGAGAAAGGLVLLADLTAPLTDEQKDNLACCVKEAIETNFTRAGLSSIACADVPSDHLAAFNEIMAKPETWAGIVQAANEPLDSMPTGCCGDEGCIFINLRYPLTLGLRTQRLDGYLRTTDWGAPVLNNNTYVKKILEASFTLPPNFKPRSISMDAFAYLPANSYSTPRTKVSFDGVLGGSIYAYEVDTQPSHYTYNHTFNILSDPSATKIIIQIESGNFNGYSLDRWLVAKAILRAVKVCGEFIV